MDNEHPAQGSESTPPLGQRIYDNWPLLLVAGLVVMLLCFTGWGLFEVLSLDSAPLP